MKKMRKYISTILFVVCLLYFVWLMLDYNGITIHKKIDHTISTGIYADGVQVGETSVTISGKYYPRLLREDSFWGKFSVAEVPETENDSLNAEITWYEEKIDGVHYEYQLITFHSNQVGSAHIEETGGAFMLSMNRSMDEMVWAIDADRVLATSAQAYQNYVEKQNQ